MHYRHGQESALQKGHLTMPAYRILSPPYSIVAIQNYAYGAISGTEASFDTPAPV
jgi:hypothetical protein